MKTKFFTFFLALVVSVGTMFAEKVKIGDLYYNLKEDKTAEVTYELYWSENNYSGLTAATIPASVTYNSVTYGVTSIGYSAFYECRGLTSVTIPNSVTSIADNAFWGCGLTSVTIPNSVTSIGYGVFNSCGHLISVTIGTGLTHIGNYAFRGCRGLTSVTISNSVKSIGIQAFSNCSSLTSITIPNSVISIGEEAFSGCTSLTSVTIPNSVTSIGERAFRSCSSLTSVTIGNSVTSIGTGAFSDCSLTSIVVENENMVYDSRNNCNAIINTATNTLIAGCKNTIIPNSVTSIGAHAFDRCTGLTSVTIPNSVTSIGKYAFSDCSGLTSVTIPNSVKSIGGWAFDGCSDLTSVTIETETPPTLGDYNTFVGDYPIYVPCNAVNTYKTAYKWNSYADRIYKKHDCPSDLPKITVRLDPSSCSSWSTVRLWAWTDASNIFDSWPGQIVSKDSEGWYSYTFEEDITSVNIIWNNGTDQTVNIEGVTSSTCYALNSTSGKAITVSVVNCPTGESQGIEDVLSDQVQCTKVVRNGQIYILRGDKTYTLTGQETIMP